MQPIAGYENRYCVTENGDVYSLRRNIWLKTRLDKDGYVVTSFIRQVMKIHRMVALAFVSNPDNKRDVNHKDGNKLNNHYTNLEWCTPKENNVHAFKMGLKQSRGEHYTARPILDTQTGIYYDCVLDAAEARGLKYSSVVSATSQGRKFHGLVAV